VDGEKHTINWGECLACGRCVEHCPYGALAIKGYRVSAEALVAKAVRMKPFFAHSGGGVTLTGGEVTRQSSFAAAVLEGCQSSNIHTAIETSGACGWPQLEKLVARADLVLYDLKLIDDEEHRRWTGVSNRRILRNAAKIIGYNTQIRVPLIANITDTEENLRGIFAFMRSVGLSSVALLPYNPSASAKYEWLGLTYEIQGEPQSSDRLDEFVAMASKLGLKAIKG
jgi:pyruvate formate lyase activating enzyme